MAEIEWLSFGFSAVAVIISAATAITGLILTWINHRKSFDPIMIIDSEKNPEQTNVKAVKEVCLRNVGRGTGYLVCMRFIDAKNNYYYLPSIDVVTTKEVCFIQKSKITSRDDDSKSVYISELTKPVLISIEYESETGRKKADYFYTKDYDDFRVLSRKRFRQMHRALK